MLEFDVIRDDSRLSFGEAEACPVFRTFRVLDLRHCRLKMHNSQQSANKTTNNFPFTNIVFKLYYGFKYIANMCSTNFVTSRSFKLNVISLLLPQMMIFAERRMEEVAAFCIEFNSRIFIGLAS